MHAVRCDGVVDCKLKSDELGCGKQAGHGCVCAHVCGHMYVCTLVTANSNGRQWAENQRIWVLTIETLWLKSDLEYCVTWANHFLWASVYVLLLFA